MNKFYICTMSVLVIDNYDSFTYNLVHLIEKITGREACVVMHDKVNFTEVERYDRIVLSPGPGLPSEAGDLCKIIKLFSGKIPMLGVCLGHQAIAEVHGATLINLPQVYHGISTAMHIVNRGEILRDIPQIFMAGRYHSWVVKPPLPVGFELLAQDEEGNIMAFENEEMKLAGVQFHPESILTPCGEMIIRNWLNSTR